MQPPLHRIARAMCRIYYQGLSVKRKESRRGYEIARLRRALEEVEE